MTQFHSRRVMPGGIICIDNALYQVPAQLAGHAIIIDLDRLEYRPVSIVRADEPVPTIITLRPGLLTAHEINDRAAHAASGVTLEQP